MTIGNNSNSEFEEISAPRTKGNQFKAVTGKQTIYMLLLMSCFSVSRAMQPDLNLTIIAAAGPVKTQGEKTPASQAIKSTLAKQQTLIEYGNIILCACPHDAFLTLLVLSSS